MTRDKVRAHSISSYGVGFENNSMPSPTIKSNVRCHEL